MAVTLVNGEAFTFAQITSVYLGSTLPSMTSIEYGEDQEKTNNMGTGNRPVSRGRGPIDASGTIELAMNDIEALRNAAPNRSLLQLPPSDYILVFGNPPTIQTHVLKAFEFKTDGGGGTTGDTDLKKSFDFIISEVQYK